jgi:hypothetical protein
MDKTRIIRGRKVVFERKDPVGDLRFTLDVFDERDNLVEVLGRVAADLEVAYAAFEAAVAQYPEKRIFLRETCRVHRPTAGAPHPVGRQAVGRDFESNPKQICSDDLQCFNIDGE